ncbi:hypothetical protein BJX64DRAFT_296528 [Aspergillus heterothallicus]
MPSNLYCPFCGIILLAERYLDPSHSPASRDRPWYAQVRAVYPTDLATGDIAITGRGVIRTRVDFYAPLDESLTELDVEAGSLEGWQLCGPADSRWAFGFHDACWRLLLLRLRLDRPHSTIEIAKSLFRLLYCTPCIESSSFYFGHDYLGAAETQKAAGRPKAVDPSTHFYADPCTISSLDELCTGEDYVVLQSGQLRIGHRTASSCKDAKVRAPGHRVFGALSYELKLEILSYLSFQELLTARLVCRDLSLLADPHSLPQSYWKSRFLLGQEADFLFPNLTRKRDWATLFLRIKAALRAGNLHLNNRRRLRQLLEPIASLIERDTVYQDYPAGLVLSPTNDKDTFCYLVHSSESQSILHCLQTISFASGEMTHVSADSLLKEGCRVLYHRACQLMAVADETLGRIGVSTVQVGARTFISGISMLSLTGSESLRCLGYRDPTNEKWIEIPPTTYLEVIWVAFSSEGLTAFGIQVPGSKCVTWVGESSGPGIACGTLVIPQDISSCGLYVGLDNFKIVSLGIGTLQSLPPASKEHPSSQFAMHVPHMPSVQSQLWAPHPPEHDDLRISLRYPITPPRAFEPLLNIDFGGQNGQLLGNLTRLVFHMVALTLPLIGIELCYSDGGSTLFGSRGGCAISLFLDGVGGERINRVGVIKDRDYPTYGLAGLQISTTYGRTSVVCPLAYRIDPSVENISLPTPDSTITGLLAQQQQRRVAQTRLTRVGIQTQQCGALTTAPPNLDHDRHHVPDEQLRYDRKHFSRWVGSSNPSTYHTFAALKKVRKISASTGIEGQSRCAGRISGLKIDYYDHPSPGVVGQWMRELDDGFELSRDEHLRLLTLRLTPTGISREVRGLQLCQVVCVQIETTLGRSVTFRTPSFPNTTAHLIQHQYQTDAAEGFTGISWIMNLDYDCVRAIHPLESSGETHTFVPELEPPFDLIQTILFERKNSNGHEETMVQAEAYFRDGAIAGLVFTYTSGTKAKIGDIESGTYQTYQLPLDIRVVGLSVSVIQEQVAEIEFEMENRNDELNHKRHSLCIRSSKDPIEAEAFLDGWRDVWSADELSSDGGNRTLGRGRAYKPPEKSRLLGLAVNCQDFHRIGAVYASAEYYQDE